MGKDFTCNVIVLLPTEITEAEVMIITAELVNLTAGPPSILSFREIKLKKFLTSGLGTIFFIFAINFYDS